MKLLAAVMFAALGLTLAAGCAQTTPGTSRPLGKVEYGAAFAVSREVLGRHFTIAQADPDKGVIRSQPLPADPATEGLLGGANDARRLATLQILREGGQVTAHLSVAYQVQETQAYRRMAGPSDNYDSVPNKSPAEEDAPYSPEQQELWRTRRQDQAMERSILQEIYEALHPSTN